MLFAFDGDNSEVAVGQDRSSAAAGGHGKSVNAIKANKGTDATVERALCRSNSLARSTPNPNLILPSTFYPSQGWGKVPYLGKSTSFEELSYV